MLTRPGEAGADTFTLMKIAGHGSVAMAARYQHPSSETNENAISRLEGVKVAHGGHTPSDDDPKSDA